MSGFNLSNASFDRSKVVMVAEGNTAPIHMGDDTHVNVQEYDLKEVAKEIATFFSKLDDDKTSKNMLSPEVRQSLVDAQESAENGDRTSTYQHLRNAGEVALKIVQKFGVNLVAELLSRLVVNSSMK